MPIVLFLLLDSAIRGVISKSKTDQFGAGKILPISEELFMLLAKWKGIVGNGGWQTGSTTMKYLRNFIFLEKNNHVK